MPVRIIRRTRPEFPAVDEGQKFRNDDPSTSVAAALDFDPQPVQKIIIACLKKYPDGLTNRQICEYTGLEWNTASPRMRPLARANVVRENGKRKWGKWPTAIVWVLV